MGTYAVLYSIYLIIYLSFNTMGDKTVPSSRRVILAKKSTICLVVRYLYVTAYK